MIYLDNASTTPLNPQITKIITDSLINDFGNPSNLYSLGKQSKFLIEEARKNIALYLNCKPTEIYFTSGASESNNMAIAQRSSCWCSPYEHHSVLSNPKSEVHNNLSDLLKSLYVCKNYKQLDKIKSNILISHMLVNNETGQIFTDELNEIIDLAHKNGIIVHTDATQAMGKIQIDLSKLKVDMLSLSGHKINCPKGIGLLFIRENVSNIHPFIYGGHQERGMRAGTENIPYILGLSKGIEIASSNIDYSHIYCNHLKEEFLKILFKSNIDFILNSPTKSIPSIINISFKNIEGEVLGDILSENNIMVGTGSACVSGDFEPSHVLTAMNIPNDYINGTLRISTSIYNTKEDIIKCANKICEIYKEINHE